MKREWKDMYDEVYDVGVYTREHKWLFAIVITMLIVLLPYILFVAPFVLTVMSAVITTKEMAEGKIERSFECWRWMVFNHCGEGITCFIAEMSGTFNLKKLYG